jgi:hypothetical protein
MTKTKWHVKPIYVMFTLALVLSMGIVAMPIAGAVEALPLPSDVWVCPAGDCGHPGYA